MDTIKDKVIEDLRAQGRCVDDDHIMHKLAALVVEQYPSLSRPAEILASGDDEETGKHAEDLAEAVAVLANVTGGFLAQALLIAGPNLFYASLTRVMDVVYRSAINHAKICHEMGVAEAVAQQEAAGAAKN